MSFSDDFSGVSSDTPLSARAGWTLLAGSDSVVVTAAGNLKKLTGATAVSCYVRPDDGSKEQRAALDFPAIVSGGPVVLASGTDVNSLNAYILRLSSATGFQVRRINNGAVEGSAMFSGTIASGDFTGLELRAIVASDNTRVDVSVWQRGTQIASFADNTPNRKTSGRRGVATTTAGNIANFADNYSDNHTTPTNLSIGIPAVPFYENITGPATMGVTGTVLTAVTAIQARLIQVDSDGTFVSVVEGFDWATKVASPPAVGQSYSFTFDNPPRGGPYRVQVRDSANQSMVTTGSIDRHVSAVLAVWGQSQVHELFREIEDASGTVPAGAQVYSLQMASKLNPGTPGYARITTASNHGTGLKAVAAQWYDDNGALPLLLIDLSIVGQSINTFLNDLTPDNSGGGTWTWTAWTGFVTSMLGSAYNRVSGILFMQGSSDVSTRQTYAARMQQLADKFDALLSQTTYPFIVIPHQRSDDGGNTWDMRNIQYNKAISGGRWRLGGFSLDTQLDENGSPHMLHTQTGSPRCGAVWARAASVHVLGLNLPFRGPTPVSAVISSDRTFIDVTFDRDIETRDGSTTALPGFWVSTDDGVTYPVLANGVGAITAARTLRISKVGGGAFAAGVHRVDFYRGVPFASDSASPDYAGPEADANVNYLSKMLTDTSAFNGGQGMTAAPAMNSGYAVAQAGNYVLIDNQPAAGATAGVAKTVTLTKAQAATLRFAAGSRVASTGAEAIGLRWERKTGDLTGKPIDGINVPVTVTV